MLLLVPGHERTRNFCFVSLLVEEKLFDFNVPDDSPYTLDDGGLLISKQFFTTSIIRVKKGTACFVGFIFHNVMRGMQYFVVADFSGHICMTVGSTACPKTSSKQRLEHDSAV